MASPFLASLTSSSARVRGGGDDRGSRGRCRPSTSSSAVAMMAANRTGLCGEPCRTPLLCGMLVIRFSHCHP